MKKKLAIVILAIAIVALWVTPAFAAKGVITDVNPSGITTVNQDGADGGTTNPSGSNPGDNAGGHASENATGVDPTEQGINGGASDCPAAGTC